MESKISLFARYIKHNYMFEIKQPLFSKLNKKEKSGFEIDIKKRKIVIMQTPTHSNLGDHAIAYAQINFSKHHFCDYQVIEIPYNDVYAKAKELKKILTKDDFIFIIGGGNMGDLYIYEEYMRRFIVKYFKEINIISFPQTITFSNSLYGKLQLLKSRRVYNKHNKLYIVAREEKSFNIMKNNFGEQKVLLTPDIVLSLDMRKNVDRKGIVTCIRKDKESILSPKMVEKLNETLMRNFDKVTITDTITDYAISIEKRNEELVKIWDLFNKSEVVITDRLHGMIFCAITGTPCLVFDNSNNKIRESYNRWLTDIEYIKFTNIYEVEKIMEIIQDLKSANYNKSIFHSCKEKFYPLIQIIKEQV